MTDKELIEAALDARQMAYTPYSGFAVGAALLAKDGRVYTGCNIENAGFTPSNCAERTAIFKAVSEGNKDFAKIAIVGGKAGSEPDSMTPPCGVCRQVMREFCDPDSFEIIAAISVDDYVTYTLEQLLPEGFGPSNLGK